MVLTNRANVTLAIWLSYFLSLPSSICMTHQVIALCSLAACPDFLNKNDSRQQVLTC